MKLKTLLGQTCSGKTQLSLDWARRLQSCGEDVVIVNCDSRQIYRYLSIGTAKIEGVWAPYLDKFQAYYYQDIPHFMIDYVDPLVRFSLAEFLHDWCTLFDKELAGFGGTVLLVGGTGLWAKAINDSYQPGLIIPKYLNEYNSLKQDLSSQSLSTLQQFSHTPPLNESDYHNPRRLINSILRTTSTLEGWTYQLTHPDFEQKIIYTIEIDQTILQSKIASQIKGRIENGFVNEVESLVHLGDRLFELGLDYRLTYLMLLGQLTEEEWHNRIIQENLNYAKRQRTWLKKQSSIIIS